jgi:Mrp family chromosome partitioning ATPase/capsular polysaccharide biosynthesis protein
MPEFSDLVLACRHRLGLTAILGSTVTFALAVVAWFYTGSVYQADSTVRVRQHQDVVFLAQTSRADDLAFFRSQEQLALSPQVLAAALEDESLISHAGQIPTQDAVDWLRGRTTVEIQAGPEVMNITVAHPSAQLAQTLCNAITRAYLNEISSRLDSDQRRRQEELERAAREADRQLDDLWGRLNSVATSIGSDNSQSLTIRDEIQLQAYRDYAQQLRNAQLRGNELQSQLAEEQLKAAGQTETFDDAAETLLHNHRDVVAARERIGRIDSQIQQVREIVADDNSPRLAKILDDRQFLIAELGRLMSELRPEMQRASREQRESQLAAGVIQLQKQIELNDAEKEFLRTRMAEIDTSIVRTDEKNGIQLEMARHAVERQTRLADGLWQSLEELKIENQSQPRVTLMSLATLPQFASHGRQLKSVAATFCLGWLLVVMGIGYLEWNSCRVRSSRDVAARSQHLVFGAESPAAQKHSTHGVQKSDGITRGAREAAAKLMLFNRTGTAIPSVLVSSASATEPRSLVAMDLARAFCAFRRRTILIDCDATGFTLSQALGVEQANGLVQISANHRDPKDFIIPSSEAILDFLPLGFSADEAPWIDPHTLQYVIRCLRNRYDAIVINGPAVMSSAESLLLASQVDQTLFAVFANMTRWDLLSASEQVASDAGISIAGSILHSGSKPTPIQLKSDYSPSTSNHSSHGESIDDEVNMLQARVKELQDEVDRAARTQVLTPTPTPQGT